jgi:hypothetical protein
MHLLYFLESVEVFFSNDIIGLDSNLVFWIMSDLSSISITFIHGLEDEDLDSDLVFPFNLLNFSATFYS